MSTSNKQDRQQQTSTPVATTMIRTDHKNEDAQQQSTETCIIPQHSDDTETKDFYFKHGLRYVKPYYFDYKSHAKGRWVGMTALQMYLKEFSYYTDEYVRRAIELSRITINGQKITADRVIRPNELLCHRLHRHELPILNTSVKIIPCDNEGIIVVDKPASLPVHPCGRYRKNSLTYLLQNESVMPSRKNKSKDDDDDGKNSSSSSSSSDSKSNDDDDDEQNKGELYPIHRLDRITSGILIISKTKEYSQQLTAQMTRNEIKKVYVAIVSGKWSLSDHGANLNDDMSSSSSSSSLSSGSRDTGVNGDQMTENKVYECDTKIWAKDRRCGIWEANDTMGKYTAKTCFSLVAYDPVNDLSLLLCRPITGRTHQIRVHLQSLGHPIANDPCYGFDAERVRTDRKRKIEETKQNSAAKRQKTSENGGDGLSVQSEMPGVETVDFKTVQVETGNANIKENRKRKQRVHKEYEKRSDKSNQTNEQSTHENRKAENQKVASTSENIDATPASTSSLPPPTFDPMCKECIEESIHPVEPHELYLYLHSWVYINPGVWNVKSDLPFWLHNCFPDVNLERMNSSLGHLLESTAHLNKESVFTQEE